MRTVVLYVMMLLPAFVMQSMAQGSKNVAEWTLNFADFDRLSKHQISSRPETSRSAGVSVWDDGRVLVYSLVSTGHLAVRKPHDTAAGGWEFVLQVLNPKTGEAESSSTVYAESFSSELAVTIGGVVVSDPGHLTFYSRNFKEVLSDFRYVPLIESTSGHFPGFLRSIAGRVYATPDEQKFLLIDSDGHHSRVYTFDGKTFERISAVDFAEIDPRSISVGDDGFYFTDMKSLSRVFFCRLGGTTAEEWRTSASPSNSNEGHEPTYISSTAWLDSFHAITINDSKSRTVLYSEHRGEGIIGPGTISPDARTAAVFKDEARMGGMFDRDLHRTGLSVLLLSLKSAGPPCSIPITPVPTSQAAVKFMSDSQLIVLHDASVSSYMLPCRE